jgi:D-alanyl-D-alanine carboxypeptidase/D-alanyl-D-alanine-endopeptidase (penicillin-binding protein 4)
MKGVARLTVLALLALASHASGASLAGNIERLLSSSPAARTAFWGIQVVDLESGKMLYESNPDHFFVPASNTKLFTTSMALERLGAGHTFETRVLADAPPDAQGRVPGALRLVGGGDPNLSGRTLPYRMGAPAGDPLAPIEALANQVAARGVKQVEGDIVGDDTWYVWEPYPAGWGIEDPESDDGPPVSALTLNDNVQTITVRPGAREGDLAAISLSPAIEFYRIDNRLRTTAAGTERQIHFDRVPGSRQARLWGTIPLRDRGFEMLAGIEDPAEYAAMALRQALEERGITVEGSAVARHRYPNEVQDLKQAPAEPAETGVELARLVSAPLAEDLQVTDKVSQNLHAELALRAVGRARRNVGSYEAGLEELKEFLEQAGIAPESYSFHDGSGLARLNLVTPAAVVELLRYMWRTPLRDAWLSLLPVAAVDGTLSSRFGESPAAGRVHAKTGSLSHVSALSGYIERKDGKWVVFSILANNYNAHPAEVRGVMDRICNLIVE